MSGNRKTRWWRAVVLALGAASATAGCAESPPGSVPETSPTPAASAQGPGPGTATAGLKQAALLVELPTALCNTPDGMALLPDGNIILSVPNCNDASQPPVLMKITPDNKAEKFYDLPPNPDTGENFGPLGLCVAPSGDLLVADYQAGGVRKSRVVRIGIQHGKPAGVVTVVNGFSIPNAVIVHDGYLFVSDTQIDAEARPCPSGVFRFKLEELGPEPVDLVTPLSKDPHLIATIETFNEQLPLGADGLAFDNQGNLYVANFSDGTVHRIRFDADGHVTGNAIFAKADFMKSADGLLWDPRRERIYVADSRANAVQIVLPDGSVQTLAQNGDTDGLDGGMDQPCETILRGNQLIVSNMDWPVPGCVNTQYDKPCTLSVITLDGS